MRCLTRSTKRGRRGVLELQDETRKSDKLLIIHSNLHPTNQQVVQFTFWSTFNARKKPRATLDSQDSSQPGFEGSHHLPPYSILCVSPWHLHPNGFFIPGLPRRSPETILVQTPATSKGHNYLFIPPIGMMSKANLYLSSRDFQQRVALHLHALKSGRFSTFGGWESNCQFDSRPFFLP